MDIVDWIEICERVAAATLLVESVARLADTSEVPESVLTRADDALRRLSSDLRRVDPGDMYSKFDAARSFTIKELVRVLVQRHSSLGTLVSRHLVHSLVYAVAMLRNAVRERNLLHDLEEVDFVPKYEELEQLKAIAASDSV